MAPSFWFLSINVPIFCCNSFEIVSGRRGSNFVAVHRQNVGQIACLFLYVMLLEKRGVFFWKKKSQNGRWPQLFSPKMCSVKPVLPEELKKFGCLCSKYLTSLLRHVYVDRLVWTKFLHVKISTPVHLYRGLYGRLSPFWHDCSLRCALRRSHVKGDRENAITLNKLTPAVDCSFAMVRSIINPSIYPLPLITLFLSLSLSLSHLNRMVNGI